MNVTVNIHIIIHRNGTTKVTRKKILWSWNSWNVTSVTVAALMIHRNMFPFRNKESISDPAVILHHDFVFVMSNRLDG